MEKQWWEDAPLADDGGNWWEAAPIASETTKESQESGAKKAALTVASGVDRGLVGLTGGIGQFLQAPAANTLAAIKGGDATLTKGENWLRSKTGMQPLKATDEINKDAQMASAFAAEQRDANVNAEGGTWANPLTALARIGKGLQEDSRERLAKAAEYDQKNYPEFVKQQRNLSDAEGFVGNLKAIRDNPLAFTHTAAKSLPDMLAGVGAARVAAAGKLATAEAAGSEVAAKVAAAGLGEAAAARAAKRAVDSVQKEAMAKASTAGMLAEGASSAYQSREGVYQTVAGMPIEKLSQSPRFQELSASTGSPEQAREMLANELADQVSLLSAAGTVTGTVLNNRLFGGDATAKAVAGVGRVGAKETGKRIAAEGTEEVIQGAPEDLVNFGAVSQADPSAKWDPSGAAAQNLAAGIAMGGAGHGSRYAAGRVASFTPANSPTAQAGLPEIVVPIVPIVPTKEQQTDVSTRDALGPLVAEGGQSIGDQPSPSVGAERLGTDAGGRELGGSPGGVVGLGEQTAPVRDTTGEQAAPVERTQNPLVRASDADLLARVTSQVEQATPANQAIPSESTPTNQVQPVTIWTGRAGDGYADMEAAQAGLQTRIKREPELRWEVEQMPSGKYRLAGYEQGNQSAIPAGSAAVQQPAQTIQPEIKRDSFDTSPQPVQNPANFEQVQWGATPATPAPKPLDMRLIPMSKRAEYAASIGQAAQPAQSQPAPALTDKPDGTLAVTGDPKALKQQLINAGIPSQSIMKSKTGVLIGRSQVAKVREFFAPQNVQSSIDDASAQRDTGGYGPAKQSHRDAAAEFARAISGRIEGRPTNDLLDAVAPGGGDRGREARSVDAVARRLFSREVVYVKFKGDQKFNGAVSKASPGLIFINIDSQKPLMAVLGHELTHELEKSQPGVYADLSRSLGALLKNESAYTNRLLANYKRQGISTGGLKAKQELEADIVGDNFMDPEFWQALAQEQPSLFRRIADAVIKWLDGIAKKVGVQRPFGTDQFLTDIAAAREAVANAMRQFSGAEVGAVTDGADAADTNMSIAEDTIEVDGIQRPRTNSKGQPIYPSEDGIRNFWRWFGDSKVVDADGRPLVMYHGTNKTQDGEAFAMFDSYGSNYGLFGQGAYFTDNPTVASSYVTKGKGVSPTVYSGYMSVKNPIDMDKAVTREYSQWVDAFPDVDFQNTDRVPRIGDFYTNEDFYRIAEDHFADEQYEKFEAAGALQDGLRSMGYDGVTHIGGGRVKSEGVKHKVFIAFDPEQIKSATGNQGTFDPSSADIRFSIQAPQGQRFTLPEDGATAITRIKLQDDALRMKRVIDAVKEQGGTVGEEQNFYDANTLMPGRVQSMMDDFRNDAVLPMLKKAAAADISMDELSLYAYARHAEERNAYIASINPKMQDGGSGMTNADAQAILAEFEKSGKAAEYADLHADLMGITATTRRTMLDEGLITQEQHDAMNAQYENYIPLRGFENVDAETGAVRPGTGRGINVRGKETIRALGRRSRAGDLIENVIRDYQRAVVKSEKNNVAKVLLDFVLSNQDPDLWGVDVEKGKATLNKATGQVEYATAIDKGEDTIGVKVGGEQVYIKIEDKALARALRHAWKDETGDLERAAVAVSGWYNTLLRNVLTRYNPPFAVVNTIRDAQSGAVAALDELGAKGAKRFAFYYPKAVAASYRGERGWGTGTIFQNPVMDRYFNEFKNSGAITGGFFMKDLGDIASDMRTDMLQYGAAPKNMSERARASIPWFVGSKVLRALEFMGSVSENTTRFALYMAARDSGRTPSEAALLAKNGTTNFNRKGEWGGTLNALYLFFNAAVQGNAQLFKTLKKPKVRAALSVVAGVGVAAAMFGASGGGEDDDGQAYWDKIPDYEKERNLIIMLPPGDTLGKGVDRVGKYGRYIKIPVQYGLNFFPNIGYMMADVYRNQQDPTKGKTIAKATKHMLSVTFGSVNPFGGSVDVTDSVSLGMALAPTILDLPIMLGTERNSFGSPVAPSKFPGDTKPDSERVFASDIDTVPANIAKTLNDMGGGNEAKPGKILGVETSVTPGTIENLIRATTGGLGMFGIQSWDFVADRVGDDGVRRKGLEPANWPAFNKVYGEVGANQNIRLAGERMREVMDVSKLIDDQLKSGISPEVSDDEKKIFALATVQETYQKEMTKLRKEEVAVLRSPEMTDEKKRLALDNIKAAQDALSAAVNRAYLKQLGPVKKGELEVSVTP